MHSFRLSIIIDRLIFIIFQFYSPISFVNMFGSGAWFFKSGTDVVVWLYLFVSDILDCLW